MALYIMASGWFVSALQWLNKIDQTIFLYVNRVFTNSFFDSVIPIWREQQTWYPLYLFLLVFTLMNFGKRAWMWLLFFGLTIAFCDQISSGFLKDFVGRVRPCGDPQFSHYVRLLLNRCPGSGSFTSSHATNHFGMATFIVYTFGNLVKRWKGFIYLWAISICYAQVYVGVHYPFDVVGGAVLGYLIGRLLAAVYNNRFGPLMIDRPKAVIRNQPLENNQVIPEN